MFKVKNNMCPEGFLNLFSKNTNPRSSAHFHRPNVNKVYKGEHSLRYFGPIVWDNMIPEKIKSISTLTEFKREIIDWVPENCKCRLCRDYIPNLGLVIQFE